jgi:hypothetical protein
VQIFQTLVATVSSNLNKTFENDIKTQDKALQINPQNPMAWIEK